MKSQLALIALLAVSAMVLFSQNPIDASGYTQEAEAYSQFAQWIVKHGKQDIDIATRFPVFLENYKFVAEENAKDNSYFLALTKFADLTNDEFKALIGGYKAAPESVKDYDTPRTVRALPDSVDWTSKGVTGDVYNQGRCGGCWAFSASQSVGSLNAIKNGQYTELSQQQIISCDHTLKLNSGCNGGNPYLSMRYYTSSNGLESEKTYPYASGEGQNPACAYDANKVVYTNKSAKTIKGGDVSAIKQQLVEQPISIAINGGSIFFQLYGGGILTNTACAANLDHAVNMVGYDASGSTPYWNIKNSWGPDWGINGYIHIAITEKDGAGICGCQSDPSYPTA